MGRNKMDYKQIYHDTKTRDYDGKNESYIGITVYEPDSYNFPFMFEYSRGNQYIDGEIKSKFDLKTFKPMNMAMAIREAINWIDCAEFEPLKEDRK